MIFFFTSTNTIIQVYQLTDNHSVFVDSRLYHTSIQTDFKWVQNVCENGEGKGSSSLFPCLRQLINNGLEVDRREVIFRLSKQRNFSPRNLLCGSCLAVGNLYFVYAERKLWNSSSYLFFLTYLIWDLRYQDITIKAFTSSFSGWPVPGNPVTFLGQFFYMIPDCIQMSITYVFCSGENKWTTSPYLFFFFSNHCSDTFPGFGLGLSRLLVEYAHSFKLSFEYLCVYIYTYTTIYQYVACLTQFYLFNFPKGTASLNWNGCS